MKAGLQENLKKKLRKITNLNAVSQECWIGKKREADHFNNMNYLIWRTPQYNSSHWNQGMLYEFLDYLVRFVRLFTMMDEEGNYLNNVLQYFQWGCAKGSTRWQEGWNQTGQHRHLRQRERCLGSVQWKCRLWEMQADYSTLEPGLATLNDLISLNRWE